MEARSAGSASPLGALFRHGHHGREAAARKINWCHTSFSRLGGWCRFTPTSCSRGDLRRIGACMYGTWSSASCRCSSPAVVGLYAGVLLGKKSRRTSVRCPFSFSWGLGLSADHPGLTRRSRWSSPSSARSSITNPVPHGLSSESLTLSRPATRNTASAGSLAGANTHWYPKRHHSDSDACRLFFMIIPIWRLAGSLGRKNSNSSVAGHHSRSRTTAFSPRWSASSSSSAARTFFFPALSLLPDLS